MQSTSQTASVSGAFVSWLNIKHASPLQNSSPPGTDSARVPSPMKLASLLSLPAAPSESRSTAMEDRSYFESWHDEAETAVSPASASAKAKPKKIVTSVREPSELVMHLSLIHI